MSLENGLDTVLAIKGRLEGELEIVKREIHELINQISMRDHGYREGSIVQVQISTGYGTNKKTKEHKALVEEIETFFDKAWALKIRLATKSGDWSKNTTRIYLRDDPECDRVLSVIEAEPKGGE